MSNSFQTKLKSLNFPPTFLSVTSLKEKFEYKVLKLSPLSTVYGSRVTVDIEVEDGSLKRVILPQRFQDLLDEIEDINQIISENPGKNFLIYKGKLGNTGDVNLIIDC